MNRKIKLLFVCMGNICRSPTAEGVMREIIKQNDTASVLSIDSAGTHDYHIGSQPDRRAIEAALTRNIDISQLSARQVKPADFYDFDYILAADRDNIYHLQQMKKEDSNATLSLITAHSEQYENMEIPDPYFGAGNGFEVVLDMLEDACLGFHQYLYKRTKA